MPLLANGQELGRRCSCGSCALRCLLLPTRDWGACYRRPASLMRRAGKRSGRCRRRRPTRHRHTKLGCSRSPCSYVPLLLRPFCGWWLCYRRYTIRVVPGGYVRRRLLFSFSSWPYHCKKGWQRWHTPSSWGSRWQLFMHLRRPIRIVCSVSLLRSLRRPCGLRGGAALIITCAALNCIGARSKFPVSVCSKVTLSLVGVCLASLSGLLPYAGL